MRSAQSVRSCCAVLADGAVRAAAGAARLRQSQQRDGDQSEGPSGGHGHGAARGGGEGVQRAGCGGSSRGLKE